MRETDELTAAELRFEQALKSLRPTAARIDPLAAALAARRRASRRRVRLWQTAAAAITIAATGGVWLALGLRGQGPSRIEAPEVSAGLRFAAIVDPDVEPPTMLAYRRALAQSPAEFDELLDQHAAVGPGRDVDVTRVGVAVFWRLEL